MRRCFLLFLNCWAFAHANEPAVALLPAQSPARTDISPNMQSSSSSAPAPQTDDLAEVVISNGTAPAWSGYKTAESLATNGQPEIALKQLEARLAIAPDDARAAYLKGLILMQQGKTDDAERWFKMMQSNFPNLPQPYNALAIIYTGRDDLESAQNVLQALLMQHPNHHNARVNLAHIYLRLARENYQQALKAKPNDDTIKNILKNLETLP